MTFNTSLFQRLRPELIEIMELSPNRVIEPGTRLTELGLDSLKAAEICALLEYSYDSIIPLERFLDDLSVEQLMGHIVVSNTES